MTAINARIPRSEIKAATIVADEKPASGYMRFSFFLSCNCCIVAPISRYHTLPNLRLVAPGGRFKNRATRFTGPRSKM